MAREFGVSPDECKTAIKRIDRWNVRTTVLPFLAGVCAFGAWAGVCILILVALEQFAPRIYEWTLREDVRDYFPFSWIVALLLAIAACEAVRLYYLRPALRRRLTAHWCVHCGYDLAGLPIVPPSRTCPECGKQSPVATG